MMALPAPVPSVHATLTRCNDSVAAAGSMVPVPTASVVSVKVTPLTVTRPCSPAGSANWSSPLITPPCPFSPVKNDWLAPLLLKVSAVGPRLSVTAEVRVVVGFSDGSPRPQPARSIVRRREARRTRIDGTYITVEQQPSHPTDGRRT